MTGPTPEELLAALDPEQREVAVNPSGPMVVLAGAGTGKTRAITHRIAYGVTAGVYHPSRVLAVTFTARAAGEMRTRLRTLGVPAVQARTFHAAALRQLQFFWPQAVGGAPPEVVAQKIPLVVEAAGRLRLRLDRAALRDVAAEIEWAKVSLLTPAGYAAATRTAERRAGGLDRTAMARLMEVYAEVCEERHVIDFEDVLLLTLGMLDEHPRIAAQVREQYRHFVVDEYQDVNPLQQHLLQAWLGERHDLCVVGDPWQSIYSFTGASADHLLTFTERHPSARRVTLVRNYRSSPQLIRLANLVLAPARPNTAGPEPTATAATGSGPGPDRLRPAPKAAQLELIAQRAAGPNPELTAYADDEAEAEGVAAAIGKLLADGIDPSEVAVLFRTNGQSEEVESALGRAGIPYLVRGGERFFARAEVRSAIVLLRGAVRSEDVTVPMPEIVRGVLSPTGWSPEPPNVTGAVRDRWESVDALVRLADELARTHPEARIRELVAELDRRAAEQHAPQVRGITLASLHAAKGLEWDAVFLIGCSEGLLPITLADTAERVAEERRLLYVGITRARQLLQISWAQSRSQGARSNRTVSRFLAPAAVVLGEGAGATSPGAGRRGGKRSARETTRTLRTCRSCGTMLHTAADRKIGRCSHCPPTYDEAVFAALREWRKQTAERDNVPAFVVFTDATLTAIAEEAPKSEMALGKISGVGNVKLQRYSADVLEILATRAGE